MGIVETDALTRKYGELTAVDHLSISIDAGEIFGLLGPNGAGKSTLIKMLTTLLPPTSGSANINGHDVVREAGCVRRIIGYVPQLLSADGSLTGYENMLVFAELYSIPRSERESRINQALEFTGLADAADRLVREYSGGMIRRLEIGQSTLHRPSVLFLDEPTIGLDPLARAAVWEHIRELRDRYGIAMILTTHLMDEADSLSDRVAIMNAGKTVVTGVPADLKASLHKKNATLDDVFVHYAGGRLETAGGYREAARTRRDVRRRG